MRQCSVLLSVDELRLSVWGKQRKIVSVQSAQKDVTMSLVISDDVLSASGLESRGAVSRGYFAAFSAGQAEFGKGSRAARYVPDSLSATALGARHLRPLRCR